MRSAGCRGMRKVLRGEAARRRALAEKEGGGVRARGLVGAGGGQGARRAGVGLGVTKRAWNRLMLEVIELQVMLGSALRLQSPCCEQEPGRIVRRGIPRNGSGTVWHGLAQSGTLWHALARSGTLWHGPARSGTVRHSPAQSGTGPVLDRHGRASPTWSCRHRSISRHIHTAATPHHKGMGQSHPK